MADRPDSEAAAHVVDSLAAVLFDEFARLAPGGPLSAASYGDAQEVERELYREVVVRLLEERGMLHLALGLPGDYREGWRAEAGIEADVFAGE